MSRGPGRLERAIFLSISEHDAAVAAGRITAPWTYSSRSLATHSYERSDGSWSPNWRPTAAQRGMCVRAMRRFAQRNPRYAVLGGEGRRHLWLHDTEDWRSRAWIELQFRKERFVSWSEAHAQIASQGAA